MTYTNDRRFSVGSSAAAIPAGAPAVYSARWIDCGSRADIVPDRQGFAFNDPADRDELIALLFSVDPASKVAALPRDVSTCLTPGADDVQVWVRRAGGYFYVEAWIPPRNVEAPDLDHAADGMALDVYDVSAAQVGDDLVLTLDTGDHDFVLRLNWIMGDTSMPAMLRDALRHSNVAMFTSEGSPLPTRTVRS